MISEEKCFLSYILSTDQISLPSSLTSWDIGQYAIAIVYYPGCDVIDFGINLIFPIKPISCMTKKLKQTFKYFENEKRF